MARRRMPVRGFVRPAPRSNVWVGAGLAISTISSGTTLLATLNAAALALRPFTIVRTHLAIHYTSDQEAVSEFSQAVLSTQVVTETAAASGVAAIPTPIAETDADFLVYKPLFSDYQAIVTIGGFQDKIGDAQWSQVDSKAMRKVGTDDQVVFVLQQRAAIGALIALEGRMLIKLH